MAYTKQTWVDRVVQFANRFTKSNETATSVTLTADPGTVTQAGSPLSAARLNHMEAGIEAAAATADAAAKKAEGRTAPNNNLNDIVESGFYSVDSATANTPGVGGSGSTVIASVYNSSNMELIYLGRTSDSYFFRRKSAGTWSSWISIMTSLGGSITGDTIFDNGKGVYGKDAAGNPQLIGAFASETVLLGDADYPTTIRGTAVSSPVSITTPSVIVSYTVSESQLGSAYPLGVSYSSVANWNTNVTGTVLTVNHSNIRCFQMLFEHGSTGSPNRTFRRVFHATPNAWTPWVEIITSAGGTLENLLVDRSPSIGSTVGSSLDLLVAQGKSGNTNKLVTRLWRDIAGSDWNGVALELFRMVDSTQQQTIRFEPGGNINLVPYNNGAVRAGGREVQVKDSGNISNFNTALTQGFYSFDNSTTNGPEANQWGVCQNFVNGGGTHNNSSNWIWQFAWLTNGNSYYRLKVNNGAWQAWTKVWTEQNDGSGSGLDADLLDGLNASSFARAMVIPLYQAQDYVTDAQNSIIADNRFLWQNALAAGKTVYFEAIYRATSGTAFVSLARTATAINTSTTSTSHTRVRSDVTSIINGWDNSEIWVTVGSNAQMRAARLIIV